MLKERLLARKKASGASDDDAERFVSFSDMANVKLCLEKTKSASLELMLINGGFKVCQIEKSVNLYH